MIGLGFNRNNVNLVSSFLSNRFQSVRFMDALSSYLPISIGSPQGPKMGPLLWLIYANDLDIGDAILESNMPMTQRFTKPILIPLNRTSYNQQ